MQLKIELESSSLTGDSGDANSLITNKRTISTNVLIEDGGIVVLGGLIQDSDIRGEQRVPYLGRIPVIGELFKTRSRQTRQDQPHGLHPPEDPARRRRRPRIETDAKYNYIRDEQRAAGRPQVRSAAAAAVQQGAALAAASAAGHASRSAAAGQRDGHAARRAAAPRKPATGRRSAAPPKP